MNINDVVEALRKAAREVEGIEQVYIPRSITIEKGYASGRYITVLIHYIADMLEE